MAVLLAVVAACSFAGATVLQFEASQAAPQRVGLRLSLLVHLLGDRRFNLGAVLDVAGGVAQFLALKVGSVEVVMPVVASGLMVAIVSHHLLARERLRGVDLVALVLVVAALAAVLVAAPQGGSSLGPTARQLLAAGVGVGAGAVALTVARRALLQRPRLLAAVGGGVLGFVALQERSVGLLWSERGWRGVVGAWQTYALVVLGVLALVVVQTSFGRASMLVVAPVVGILEPVVGSLLAVAVEGVGPRVAPWRLAVVFAGLAVEAGAIWLLARRERPAGRRC